MKNDKTLADILTSMDDNKYDADTLKRYHQSLNRKTSLIEQGLIEERGYRLRSPEQRCELTEVLTLNRRIVLV